MANLFDPHIFSIIGLDSSIQPGAKLYWYVSGTSTPANSYADQALTIPNANPVLAGADGRFPQMWLDTGNFKYVLTAADSTPASPLVTQDPWVSSALPPTVAAGLTSFLAGTAPLPILNGGTGQTSAVNAINALGGLPSAGGTVTGDVIRSGAGVYHYWGVAGMTHGDWYVTVTGATDPTSQPGQVWAQY